MYADFFFHCGGGQIYLAPFYWKPQHRRGEFTFPFFQVVRRALTTDAKAAFWSFGAEWSLLNLHFIRGEKDKTNSPRLAALEHSLWGSAWICGTAQPLGGCRRALNFRGVRECCTAGLSAPPARCEHIGTIWGCPAPCAGSNPSRWTQGTPHSTNQHGNVTFGLSLSPPICVLWAGEGSRAAEEFGVFSGFWYHNGAQCSAALVLIELVLQLI